MNKKSLLAISISTILFANTALFAKDNTNTTIVENNSKLTAKQAVTTNKSVNALEKKQNRLLTETNKNLIVALNKVIEAIQLLKQQDKEKDAIKALEIATGKLDIAIAANPKLSLIPVDANITVTKFLTTSGTIKDVTRLAIALLKENKLQAARQLLLPMSDALHETIVYLPVKTYPNAIKKATALLVKGKKEEAANVLNVALSTLITKQSTIPLGLIRAQGLLMAASTMDKAKDKEKIKEQLSAAQEQLEITRLLGYANKETITYVKLNEQIKYLKKEINGKNAVEKFYDKLSKSIDTLIQKHIDNKVK